MNWEQVRSEFPALSKYTYLNTATFGQVPERSRAVLDAHFAHRNELACTDFLGWFDDMDEVRGSIAQLINCSAGDIGFLPNACSALALFLAGIEWQPDDRIVTLANEFPNQFYHAGFLGSRGVELVEAEPERFYDAITPRTRAVLVSNVNYINGYVAPVAEMSRFLRARGIRFYVDGTQSVGSLCFDTAAVQPDMLAVDAYKWMLSPNGAGFIYVRPDLRPHLTPNVIGWRSDRNWRSVDSLNCGAPEFSEFAEKYEGGMINFAAIYAMGDAVKLMLELGPNNIEARVLSLTDRVRAIVRTQGATVRYEGAPIVAAEFPRADAGAIAKALSTRHIITAARHGKLRVSPHFYNNDADLDAFERALKDAL